jgi:uncharacterized protein
LRAVIDTNVLVSAVLLPSSVPRQAVDLATEAGKLLLSEATLAELDEVLRRPKFDKYVPEKLRIEFLVGLVYRAEIVEVHQQPAQCRDPKNQKFLDLAYSGNASDLVSGDNDLLEMHSAQGVAIVTPQEFLRKWTRGPSGN